MNMEFIVSRRRSVVRGYAVLQLGAFVRLLPHLLVYFHFLSLFAINKEIVDKLQRRQVAITRTKYHVKCFSTVLY